MRTIKTHGITIIQHTVNSQAISHASILSLLGHFSMFFLFLNFGLPLFSFFGALALVDIDAEHTRISQSGLYLHLGATMLVYMRLINSTD